MFVGEAPGADEDATGVPFVGRAGQLLTKMIENGMGLSRKDVYIANVLKCRPPGNRNPEPVEIASCRPYLEAQIDLVKPVVLVALGKFAAHFLLENGGADHASSRAVGEPRRDPRDADLPPLLPSPAAGEEEGGLGRPPAGPPEDGSPRPGTEGRGGLLSGRRFVGPTLVVAFAAFARGPRRDLARRRTAGAKPGSPRRLRSPPPPRDELSRGTGGLGRGGSRASARRRRRRDRLGSPRGAPVPLRGLPSVLRPRRLRRRRAARLRAGLRPARRAGAPLRRRRLLRSRARIRHARLGRPRSPALDGRPEHRPLRPRRDGGRGAGGLAALAVGPRRSAASSTSTRETGKTAPSPGPSRTRGSARRPDSRAPGRVRPGGSRSSCRPASPSSPRYLLAPEMPCLRRAPASRRRSGPRLLTGLVAPVEAPPAAGGDRPSGRSWLSSTRTPFLPDAFVDLLLRAAAYYFAPPGELLRAAVPGRLLDIGQASYVPTSRAVGARMPEGSRGGGPLGDPRPRAAPRRSSSLTGSAAAGIGKALRSLLDEGLVRVPSEEMRAARPPLTKSWVARGTADRPAPRAAAEAEGRPRASRGARPSGVGGRAARRRGDARRPRRPREGRPRRRRRGGASGRCRSPRAPAAADGPDRPDRGAARGRRGHRRGARPGRRGAVPPRRRDGERQDGGLPRGAGESDRARAGRGSSSSRRSRSRRGSSAASSPASGAVSRSSTAASRTASASAAWERARRGEVDAVVGTPLGRLRAAAAARPDRRRRGARRRLQAGRGAALRRADGGARAGSPRREPSSSSARRRLRWSRSRRPATAASPGSSSRSRPGARGRAAVEVVDLRERAGAPRGPRPRPLRRAHGRAPPRGLRQGRAGDRPPEPTRLLAFAPLPRLRPRLPLRVVLRRADLPPPRRAPPLPLLRRLHPAPARLPGVRLRRPDARRLRDRTARGAVRGGLPRDLRTPSSTATPPRAGAGRRASSPTSSRGRRGRSSGRRWWRRDTTSRMRRSSPSSTPTRSSRFPTSARPNGRSSS